MRLCGTRGIDFVRITLVDFRLRLKTTKCPEALPTGAADSSFPPRNTNARSRVGRVPVEQLRGNRYAIAH